MRPTPPIATTSVRTLERSLLLRFDERGLVAAMAAQVSLDPFKGALYT